MNKDCYSNGNALSEVFNDKTNNEKDKQGLISNDVYREIKNN